MSKKFIDKYNSTKNELEKKYGKKIDIVLGTTADDSDWIQSYKKQNGEKEESK